MKIRKNKVMAGALCILILGILLILGFQKYKSTKEKQGDVFYGEDYGDGREEKWSLRNDDDKELVKIHSMEGYGLSGQSYHSCSIILLESNKIAAKVTVKEEVDLQDAIESLTGNKTNSRFDTQNEHDTKYTKLIVDQDEYLLMSNGRNTVVVKVLPVNIKEAGKELNKAESEIIDMITLK